MKLRVRWDETEIKLFHWRTSEILFQFYFSFTADVRLKRRACVCFSYTLPRSIESMRHSPSSQGSPLKARRVLKSNKYFVHSVLFLRCKFAYKCTALIAYFGVKTHAWSAVSVDITFNGITLYDKIRLRLAEVRTPICAAGNCQFVGLCSDATPWKWLQQDSCASAFKRLFLLWREGCCPLTPWTFQVGDTGKYKWRVLSSVAHLQVPICNIIIHQAICTFSERVLQLFQVLKGKVFGGRMFFWTTYKYRDVKYFPMAWFHLLSFHRWYLTVSRALGMLI